MPSPIKTVVQQGQYPVQATASLVSSGSPCKSATDPVTIRNLASAYTSRTSPLHSVPNGGIPERLSTPLAVPDSQKKPQSMYNANLPLKTALGTMALTNAVSLSLPSGKSISSLSTLKTSVDSTLSSRGGRTSVSSLSSNGQTTIPSSELSMTNGFASPHKYPSSTSTPSSPSSRLLSEKSLQERIQATTQAATTSVSAAINEAIDSCSGSSYGTLKSLASSHRSPLANSTYGALLSSASSSSSAVTSNMVTVPVYSLVNIISESPIKPGPGSLKMALPDHPPASSSSSTSLSTCVTASKIKSQLKSPPFITPPIIHSTAASNQEILKDVADMKEDLIRMTAILQSDTQTAAKTVQTSQSGTPKEMKLEDEEPISLVEKVKEDLVKVSRILQKDALTGKKRSSEDEWEEFSKEEIEEAQRSVITDHYTPFDDSTLLLKQRSMSTKDLELAKVVDFLTNDIGANSLSKMAELKSRYEEEIKQEGEEKQKRVLKPSMSIQEHKLKMPPPVSGMIRSPSEKDLSKLAESYQGSETILESPEDLSHEQDKSPLSDSGFETRSEKTPSAPQSAESTGPKPLFTDSPIPPSVSEITTDVISYEQPDDFYEPALMDEAASALPSMEPDVGLKGSSGQLQIKIPQDESIMNKSMCLKEETHITTTTRMVYHQPQLTDGADMLEEAMSVRDIMKAFQSGRDPSKELAGLFEHKAGHDSIKGDELTPRFLERDMKSKPKVERIIEVHIEKGHSTAEPTEVIIRKTKKHPDLYIYKGDRGIRELGDYDDIQQEEEELIAEETLPSFLETSRVNTPVSQEEDSRPSSAQLVGDDSYKALKLLSQQSIEYCDDELSEFRGESYRFAEKMLLSEKLDSSTLPNSDTEDSATATEKPRSLISEETGKHDTEGLRQHYRSPKKEYVPKSSKEGSPKFMQREEPSQFEKVTVLHYSTEQGSPKHAVWMRFTEDKHDRTRDKLLYEDRVDQTVKEAEEKLCEVSQFFRDKTEKLNDELQSPEKKPMRREPKETRSWPTSACSSPEKTQQKPKAGEEAFGKSKPSVDKVLGKSATTEKKSSSLPSSPKRFVVSEGSDDKLTTESEPSSPSHVKSTSKVSAVRMKFESEFQKQSSPTKVPPPVQPKPSVKKLQESKLPVFQFFTGNKVSKQSEKTGDLADNVDMVTCAVVDSNKSVTTLSSKAPKHAEDKQIGKNYKDASIQKQVFQGETGKETTNKKDTNIIVTQEIKEIIKCQKGETPTVDHTSSVLEKESGSKKSQHITKDSRGKEQIAEQLKKDDQETINKNLRKKTESQIPVKTTLPGLDNNFTNNQKTTKPSQIPTLSKSKIQQMSPEMALTKTMDLSYEILDNAPKDSNSNNLPSPKEVLEKVITPPQTITTKENFKGIKTLPVYVGVQVGRQAEREAKGALYTVKQKSNSALSPISPDDDTLEQVSFIDSSGKSPLTPETPSSEEVSYDLTVKTPDGFMGFMSGKPSPILEVSEESEGDDRNKVVFSFQEALPEKTTGVDATHEDLVNANKQITEINDNIHNLQLANKLNQQETASICRQDELTGQQDQEVSKDKGIAYIEFPPPPPLDSSSEISDPERKGSCASSETETEMMEVNLQEEQTKLLQTEPIIRIQPPSPVPPGTDDSLSNDKEADEEEEDDESIFQPIPFKKFTFKVEEEDEEEKKKKDKEKLSRANTKQKHDKNGNQKETNVGTNGSNGSSGSNGSKCSNGKGEDNDYEQNGNDQSITDCSIATTAEFSHDTDATEIDSLDGYELQDEDDGLCEQADLRLYGLPDSRRDVWATDTFRSSDRCFPQTKLEVIEEEKTPEENPMDNFKTDTPMNGRKPDDVSKNGVKCLEQKPSNQEGFSDTYFSYKLEEEFNSPFKTVATKGLDFDPWSSKGGEDEVIDTGGTQGSNGEPKPFGLAVDEQSQATTPDSTPARTPTDDSTPTSEPNPFPFHEGKMFEMTRSGAIDMSKRDMVEERLQFFQIGEHSYSSGRYNVRDSEIAASSQHRDYFTVEDPKDTSTVPQVSTQTTTVQLEISHPASSYSTCRESSSNAELKFSTFRTGVKLPSENPSSSSDSCSKSKIVFSNDMTSGRTLENLYFPSSNHTEYSNAITTNTPETYLNNSSSLSVSEQRDCVNQTSGNLILTCQSRDYSTAPSQQIRNYESWSSNTCSLRSMPNNVHVKVGHTYCMVSLSGSGLHEIHQIDPASNELPVKSKEDGLCLNVAKKHPETKKVKPRVCKSRLPMPRVPSHKLCSQNQPIRNYKAQYNVNKFQNVNSTKYRCKKRVDPFENSFFKSRIPMIKAIKCSFSSLESKQVSVMSSVSAKSIQMTRDNKQVTKSPIIEQGLPLKRSSNGTARNSNAVSQTKLKTSPSNSQVANFFDQAITKKAVTQLEGKTPPTEDGQRCSHSTTRNTPLSETSQASRSSCPSRTCTSTSTSSTTSTPSARDTKAEVEQASSVSMKSRRKSRRSLGEKEQEQKVEGRQVDQPLKALVTETETSL